MKETTNRLRPAVALGRAALALMVTLGAARARAEYDRPVLPHKHALSQTSVSGRHECGTSRILPVIESGRRWILGHFDPRDPTPLLRAWRAGSGK